MNNPSPPIINLDLDLLRTFVAVADLSTFAAAAAEVCRTQSAVSQQMQRLEQLVERELFARQGRNKLLTEHGIQLLGYARKILRFNDEACASLMYSNVQGKLSIGVTEETAETLLPYLMNRISTFYPNLEIEVLINRTTTILEALEQGRVELALTTSANHKLTKQTLRTSPTLWLCSADYAFQSGEPLPLVVQDENEIFRKMAISHLEANNLPWMTAYVATSLAAIKAAIRAGIGVSARPAEMLSPELRVLGSVEGLPALPDTEYLLCRRIGNDEPLLQSIFNILSPQSDFVGRNSQNNSDYQVEAELQEESDILVS